jgi:hypothetical protein
MMMMLAYGFVRHVRAEVLVAAIGEKILPE